MVARCGQDHRVGELVYSGVYGEGQGAVAFHRVGMGGGVAHHAGQAFGFRVGRHDRLEAVGASGQHLARGMTTFAETGFLNAIAVQVFVDFDGFLVDHVAPGDGVQ
ncbi:hypothetical protein D3C86_1966540 [compost metagenome]